MAERSHRVLAVDPALRNTGYAILTRNGQKFGVSACGTIRNPQTARFSGCLVTIDDELTRLIRKYEPAALAIETVIYVQSYRTAIVLGAARGTAILAAARLGLPVFEYPPRRVKQAVVGYGAARKDQVAFMVRAMLGLTETPTPDAADAIAIGLTHLQSEDSAHSRAKPLTAI
jgi:crossover junction endodeoxyribonuclease RuvC